jgi:hypothetical protein
VLRRLVLSFFIMSNRFLDDLLRWLLVENELLLQVYFGVKDLERSDLKVHVAKPFVKIILDLVLNVSVLEHMIESISIDHLSLELTFIHSQLRVDQWKDSPAKNLIADLHLT